MRSLKAYFIAYISAIAEAKVAIVIEKLPII
jgi:hypothetical protein